MPDNFAENVGQDLREMTVEFLTNMSELIVEELSEICSKPTTRHDTSIPYEPPGARTGEYMSSFDYHLEEHGFFIVTDIYSEDPKSEWLEYGTRHETRGRPYIMRPRPHLGPTFRKWQSVVGNRILSELE